MALQKEMAEMSTSITANGNETNNAIEKLVNMRNKLATMTMIKRASTMSQKEQIYISDEKSIPSSTATRQDSSYLPI
jgi:hypothetical protein